MNRWIWLALILLGSCLPGDRERSIREVSEMVRPWEEKEWRKVGWKESEFEIARYQDVKFEINFARKDEDKFKTCPDYGPDSGCVFVVLAKKGLLKFSLSRFKRTSEARKMAFVMGEYYFDRWVFDGVAKEPVLENFVKEVFKAEKVEKYP